MKSALIWAYTQVNLGDDLFIKILTERYPEYTFSILGSKSKLIPFTSIANLNIYNTEISKVDSLLKRVGINIGLYDRRLKKLAQKHDLTINIGGSIFIEDNNWERTLHLYDNVIKSSNSFVIIGSNFGPFHTNSYRSKYFEAFRQVNDVCFRDYASFDLFKELQIVRQAPDIVFNLNAEKVGTYRDKDYILISVMNLASKDSLKQYRDTYESNIINICHELINMGQKVKLMSFCESEGDELAIENIRSKIANPLLSAYYYKGDMDEALTVVKSSKSVVATRFHSMILAFVFKKPVFPIIYSEKSLNVLNDIDFSGNFSHVSEKINIYTLMKQLNSVELNLITLQGNNQFDYLDKVLGEC